MSIVMVLDQHRAQISAEWIDTITGEVSRARVVPADRAAVQNCKLSIQAGPTSAGPGSRSSSRSLTFNSSGAGLVAFPRPGMESLAPRKRWFGARHE